MFSYDKIMLFMCKKNALLNTVFWSPKLNQPGKALQNPYEKSSKSWIARLENLQSVGATLGGDGIFKFSQRNVEWQCPVLLCYMYVQW